MNLKYVHCSKFRINFGFSFIMNIEHIAHVNCLPIITSSFGKCVCRIFFYFKFLEHTNNNDKLYSWGYHFHFQGLKYTSKNLELKTHHHHPLKFHEFHDATLEIGNILVFFSRKIYFWLSNDILYLVKAKRTLLVYGYLPKNRTYIFSNFKMLLLLFSVTSRLLFGF